ncbi:MAG TPA: NUDIX hydrolase [Opitutaceae bacterium]
MHRTQVLGLLHAHRGHALPGEESAALEQTIAFVGAHEDCLLRTCAPGHLTGSAWIVSADRKRTLLTLHNKLGKWLQLGGHADGDPDLLAVALREAREESGLARLSAVTPAIFDIDRHWIPGRGAEAGHWHHDLRFLIEADPADPLTLSSESKELAWVEVAGACALNPEESVARMARKTPRPPQLAGERQR